MPAYQNGSVCYATAKGAVAAYASTQAVTTRTSQGSTNSCYAAAAGSEEAPVLTYKCEPQQVGGVKAADYAVAYVPPPCGLVDWQDALALSWLVVGVWIVAAIIGRMYRSAA
jgi:hypothetical protein